MEYIVHVDKDESRVPNMVIGGVEGFSVLTRALTAATSTQWLV